MVRRRKVLLFGLLSVVTVAIGYLFVDFLNHFRYVSSEYETVRVIDAVTEYVDTHEGRWPPHWDDLQVSESIREKVRIRFDVTPSDLIRDPEALRAAIQPLAGHYRTYPHSQIHYDDLRDALRDAGKPDYSRRHLK